MKENSKCKDVMRLKTKQRMGVGSPKFQGVVLEQISGKI